MRRIVALSAALLLLLAFMLPAFADDAGRGGEAQPAPADFTHVGDRYTITAPVNLRDGIVLNPHGESAIKLVRLGANTVAGQPASVETYKNLLVVFEEEGGFALLELIENASGASTFSYRLDIGRDQTVAPDGAGGYAVVNKDSEHVVSIGMPWALDANGEKVPTSYTLEDGILTLRVDHENLAPDAYPVVADPCLRFWAKKCRGKVATAAALGVASSRIVYLVGVTITVVSGGAAAPVTIPGMVGSTVAGGVTGAIACMLSCDPDEDEEEEEEEERPEPRRNNRGGR